MQASEPTPCLLGSEMLAAYGTRSSGTLKLGMRIRPCGLVTLHSPLGSPGEDEREGMLADNEKRRSVEQAVFKALSHPIRRRILEELDGPAKRTSPSRVAEMIGMPISNVGYHFIRLRNCGLIEVAHEVKRRGFVEHLYRARVKIIVITVPWR